MAFNGRTASSIRQQYLRNSPTELGHKPLCNLGIGKAPRHVPVACVAPPRPRIAWIARAWCHSRISSTFFRSRLSARSFQRGAGSRADRSSCGLCSESPRSDRQLAVMVTGPIAFTLAIAIDQQLVNTVGADRPDGDRLHIRTLSQTMSAIGGKRTSSLHSQNVRY